MTSTKKKKRKTGNTAGKAMKWLRDHDYVVAKVERWNPFAHIRQDLFGFIDIVAIRADRTGVLGVQTTSKSFLADHSQLIKSLKTVKVWLKGNNRIWLMGWEKAWKGDGSKRKIWAPIVSEVRLGKNGKLSFKKVEELTA